MMKTLLFSITVFISFCCSCQLVAQDPVRNAIKQNDEKADHNLVDKDVAELVVKIAEGRLVSINEGKLAMLKGYTTEVRSFAQSLVKDQTQMLDDLKKIAADHNITLPDGVSDKKREGQMDLSEESGEEFDEKFIKMIESVLEQDIKFLDKTQELNDATIADFSKKYSSLVQSSLQKAKAIRRENF